jgi:hypothetical protein
MAVVRKMQVAATLLIAKEQGQKLLAAKMLHLRKNHLLEAPSTTLQELRMLAPRCWS